MIYYLSEYYSDFGTVTKRLQFSVTFNNNTLTSREDDLKYIPQTLLNTYLEFVPNLGYCNFVSRVRRLRLFINSEQFISCVLPSPIYNDLIPEIGINEGILSYKVIGEKIDNPFLIKRYANGS